MFINTLDAVIRTSPALEHVTPLQGTKAYGVHLHTMPIPAREDRDEFRSVPNFYWQQEDYLRAQSSDATWN